MNAGAMKTQMNNSIIDRKYLRAFALGMGTAAVIGLLLFLMTMNSTNEICRSIIDSEIAAWTSYNASAEAGMAARLELPDAKPGYFPTKVRELADEVETTYHVPQSVTLAQWALESAWGRKNLGVSNYFGHTYAAVNRYMEHPRWIKLREQRASDGGIVNGDSVCFASYTDIRECFLTHGMYLRTSPLYRRAFTQKSPERFACEVGKCYATDPDYGMKLVIIMKRYELL